jgi:hypothetical protein
MLACILYVFVCLFICMCVYVCVCVCVCVFKSIEDMSCVGVINVCGGREG